MKKTALIVLLFICTALTVMAQSGIVGYVLGKNGKPIVGAVVKPLNQSDKKLLTDSEGKVALTIAPGQMVEVSYAGLQTSYVKVSESGFRITLDDNHNDIDLGLGRSTKLTATQSVATITADQLSDNGTQNIFETFYGLLPGASLMQSGGFNSNKNVYIRGAGTFSNQSPLYVVDGFPRPIEYLSTQEIERITVLKDGAATALWGSRGANGVILIETKRGKYKSMDFSVDYKHGNGFYQNKAKMANGLQYAQAVNEAMINDGLTPRYNQQALDAFAANTYPDVFANTNWLAEGLRNNTDQNQLTLTFRGGGEKARYFTAIDYRNDIGLFANTNLDNRYNAQLMNTALNARINMDVDVTKTTQLKVSLLATLNETRRPGTQPANDAIDALYTTPSGAFPVRTSGGYWASNTIFNSNPIAEIAATGFNRATGRMLQSDMRLTQQLNSVLNGLSAEVAFAFDNMALYNEPFTKKYAYQVNVPIFDPVSGAISTASTNYSQETNLTGTSTLGSQYMTQNLETNLKYNRQFGLNQVRGALIYRQEAYIPDGQNQSRYRQYVMGTASYSFNERFMLDGVMNYYGTSVITGPNRFTLYPALSAAFIALQNEPTIDLLKIRASWGKSGLDAFGYELENQYWEAGGAYYYTAGNTAAAGGGIKEGKLPLQNLRVEKSTKYNLGADVNMLKKLSTTLDVFYDRRSDILVDGSAVVSGIIGVGIPQLNMGVVDAYGSELALKWSDKIGDFSYYAGGNLSYVRTSIVENNEGYKPYSYLSYKGDRIGQIYGLEHIGYFADQADIAGSPVQKFGTVKPGDLKYKDQNNDNIIDQNDRIAIGKSATTPDFYYGFQLGVAFKSFGLDAQFQGVAGYSVILNTKNVFWPLQNNTNISTWYLEDNVRWTPETATTANLPRLSSINNPNNYQASTQWLADASFLKLRNLRFYYNLPAQLTKKVSLDKVQLYVSGNDLLTFSKIPYMNPEDISLKYPNLTSVYIGANINF